MFLLKNVIEIKMFILVVNFSKVKLAIASYLLRFLNLLIIFINVQYFIND